MFPRSKLIIDVAEQLVYSSELFHTGVILSHSIAKVYHALLEAIYSFPLKML